MPADSPTLMRRIVIRIRALLPDDWRGPAGKRFQQATNAISEYTEEHVRPAERLAEAPELLWSYAKGAATQKHAEATLNFAKEETERMRLEYERRTLEARVRKDRAEASKAESEARVMEIRELEARIEFADKLRNIGALPIWLPDGRMHIGKAPADFDWDSMVSEKLITTDEQVKLFAPPLPEIKGDVWVALDPVVLTAEGTVGNIVANVSDQPSTATSTADVGTNDERPPTDNRREQ